MKPDAVEQIRGKYKSIATNVRIAVCELLPKTAQVMNKLTLVRSGTHENDHHETATTGFYRDASVHRSATIQRWARWWA